MPNHENYMLRCIEIASLAAGNVSPNPMVGAVIVHNDTIIGEGYHQKYGGPHAEVNAVQAVLNRFSNAADLLKESRIYVSLEPCNHYGKTPPCSELIITHGIREVVVGCRDPFDQVNGTGIEKLRNAGVEVIEGILEDKCRELNKRFFTRIKYQRPYIILKWAQTTDRFFAPKDGSKKWITSNESKRLVHKWRSEEDAVLVGKSTALIDDPQLNVRLWNGKNPKRIVIDRNLELPKNLHLFDQSQETLVFNSIKSDIDGKIKYLEVEDFDHYLPQLICYNLYLMDVQSIIVEGGAQTLDLFIKAGLWDEARIFTSPDIWTDGIPAPILDIKPVEKVNVGRDKLEIFYNK